jgi:hypothetical protein
MVYCRAIRPQRTVDARVLRRCCPWRERALPTKRDVLHKLSYGTIFERLHRALHTVLNVSV